MQCKKTSKKIHFSNPFSCKSWEQSSFNDKPKKNVKLKLCPFEENVKKQKQNQVNFFQKEEMMQTVIVKSETKKIKSSPSFFVHDLVEI